MSSSSRVVTRVLRGDAGRRATAEVFEARPSEQHAPGRAPVTDPFAAERAAAYQEGYEAARAESAAHEADERVSRTARLAEALITAAEAARTHRQAALERAQHDAVDLAFELAETILARELDLSPSVGVEAVARALGLAPRGEDLVIRLHPDDVITPEELQALVNDASVKVVADPDVELGGCTIEAGPCCIDAQMRPALERARALITSVDPTLRGQG